MRKILLCTICWSLTFSNIAWAKKTKKKSLEYNLRELVLPSEVQKMGKTSGSIFYSPTIKGKVLIPVHFWGEVTKSGLHFVPIDSTLINALSLAGGPTGKANLEEIKLTRRSGSGKVDTTMFDLSEGGEGKTLEFKMKPDDTIFIKKSTFSEDRAYYTSLTGVIATVLSSILLYREVQNSK